MKAQYLGQTYPSFSKDSFPKSAFGSGSRLKGVWQGMMHRCLRTGEYGRKGIRVCKSWHLYIRFREWALASGYRDGLTIDRIDSAFGYSPSNCRWVPQSENSRHAVSKRYLTVFGNTEVMETLIEKFPVIRLETLYSVYRIKGREFTEQLLELRILRKLPSTKFCLT